MRVYFRSEPNITFPRNGGSQELCDVQTVTRCHTPPAPRTQPYTGGGRESGGRQSQTARSVRGRRQRLAEISSEDRQGSRAHGVAGRRAAALRRATRADGIDRGG